MSSATEAFGRDRPPGAALATGSALATGAALATGSALATGAALGAAITDAAGSDDRTATALGTTAGVVVGVATRGSVRVFWYWT
jgi:hypothetical protein